MTDRMSVTPASEEAWGKLVKTWATGESYFSNVPIAQLPVPKDIDDLKAQCALVGVTINLPATVTALTLVRYSANTMVIRLPPKQIIKDAEAAAESNQPYPLPHFYSIYCGPISPNLPPNEKKKLQNLRVGDYSISHCD